MRTAKQKVNDMVTVELTTDECYFVVKACERITRFGEGRKPDMVKEAHAILECAAAKIEKAARAAPVQPDVIRGDTFNPSLKKYKFRHAESGTPYTFDAQDTESAAKLLPVGANWEELEVLHKGEWRPVKGRQ